MSLLDGLISYWKLDEASGNAIDAHGSNDFIDENTVGTAAGKINSARDFERNNLERFYQPSNASLAVGDIDFTVSLWIKPESIVGFEFYYNKSSIAVANREFAVYNPGTIAFFVYDSLGSIKQIASGVAPVVGQWMHVLAWHDATANQIAISIDNASPATIAHSTGVRTGTFEVELGSRKDHGFYYDGLIDEVGFWKRILTPAERTKIYNSGNGLPYDKFRPAGLPTIIASHHAALGI